MSGISFPGLIKTYILRRIPDATTSADHFYWQRHLAETILQLVASSSLENLLRDSHMQVQQQKHHAKIISTMLMPRVASYST